METNGGLSKSWVLFRDLLAKCGDPESGEEQELSCLIQAPATALA